MLKDIHPGETDRIQSLLDRFARSGKFHADRVSLDTDDMELGDVMKNVADAPVEGWVDAVAFCHSAEGTFLYRLEIGGRVFFNPSYEGLDEESGLSPFLRLSKYDYPMPEGRGEVVLAMTPDNWEGLSFPAAEVFGKLEKDRMILNAESEVAALQSAAELWQLRQ